MSDPTAIPYTDEVNVQAARQRFIERAADMIPLLFESIAAGEREPEYLLGERMIDGQVARLTLRVVFVTRSR